MSARGAAQRNLDALRRLQKEGAASPGEVRQAEVERHHDADPRRSRHTGHIDAAEQRGRKEAEYMSRIMDGQTTLELYGLDS